MKGYQSRGVRSNGNGCIGFPKCTLPISNFPCIHASPLMDFHLMQLLPLSRIRLVYTCSQCEVRLCLLNHPKPAICRQLVIVQSRKTSIFDYALVNINTIRTTIQRICGYPRRGQSTIDNAGKKSLSAALCDARRIKSTLTHCNILPTIKMQTFSWFSCNHRIRAFTSKTSTRRNGNDQRHNCNDPKSDKQTCRKELTEKEQHIGFARNQSGDKEARSVDAISFHSGAEARRAGMRRQGKRRKSSPEA